jgi:MYXO-CTERM domain-containing protein
MAVVSGATAQTLPGALFVVESEGAVVEVLEGGDFTGKPRFASGLYGPACLCVGPDDDIFVSESGANQVRIITVGGDFATEDAFATGLPNAAGLACNRATVYAMSFYDGKVYEISAGGDFSSATPFATITGGSFYPSLTFDEDGELWASGDTGVWNISEGGDFDLSDRYAAHTAIPAGFGSIDSTLYIGRVSSNIVAVTMGGLDTATAFVTVPGTLRGFTASNGRGFAVSQDGDSASVFDVTAGGDFTAAAPFATGLTAIRTGGLMYYSACGDGVLQPSLGEECDDAAGNSDTMPDACRANCHPASCGDGIVDSAEDCDEGDANDDSGVCHTDCQCIDADRDGTCAVDDGCDEDADKTAPGACGCGTPDTDTDSDGTLDCDDSCPSDAEKTAPGACGCGIPDTDTDSDGTPDCDDSCPSDAEKTAPGACGCGIPDTDTDSDGTPDCDESGEDMQSDEDTPSSEDMPGDEDMQSSGMRESARVLLDTTPLAAGDADCAQGGVRLAVGADDGEPSGTAGDGVLQSGEVDSMDLICSTEATADDVRVSRDSGSCSVHAVGQGPSGFAASSMVLAVAWLHRRRRARSRN